MTRFIAFLSILLFIGCANESDTYKLEGTAPGFKDGTTIFVYELEDNRTKVVDTITIENEKFSAKYPKPETSALRFLKAGNLNQNILFFPGKENLQATLYKDSIAASFVSGGSQNLAYREYVKKVKDLNAKKVEISNKFKQARKEQDNLLASQLQLENVALDNEQIAYQKEFVKKNNNSIFSVMLISEMVNKKDLSAKEASVILENLDPEIAETVLAKDLKTALKNLKQTDIGGQAPSFEAPTPEGDMLSLEQTLGKYTIVDFWASWCKPCRMENPNVVRVYEKYHDKGLNIVSVSLDRENQKERWLQAIEADNMDWYHVSNLKFWQDPIAQLYGVRAIPETFLLDENGVIIDKNLRGAALERRIAELLGGQ